MEKTPQNSSNDSENSKENDQNSMDEKFELPDEYKNISLDVEVLVGRQTVTIEDLVNNARVGSIIELDENAGESVHLYVNNEHFGKGTLVVVNEKYGIQIDEIDE